MEQEELIFDVAQWFLCKDSMTHKKLQKLCYYAYCWFIVFFNDVESQSSELLTMHKKGFEAWVHGPVCFDLYQEYKSYGWNLIPSPNIAPSFNEDVKDLLEQVWGVYGKYSANQLERMTTREDPWRKARRGIDRCEPCSNKIDDQAIFDFYYMAMITY